MKFVYYGLRLLVAMLVAGAASASVHAASERFRTAMEIDSVVRNVLNVDSVGVDITPGGSDTRCIYLIDLAKRDRDVVPYPVLAVGAVDVSFPVDGVVLYSDGYHYEWDLGTCQAYYWVWKHVSPFLGAVGLCRAVDIASPYQLEPAVYMGAWCTTGQ